MTELQKIRIRELTHDLEHRLQEAADAKFESEKLRQQLAAANTELERLRALLQAYKEESSACGPAMDQLAACRRLLREALKSRAVRDLCGTTWAAAAKRAAGGEA